MAFFSLRIFGFVVIVITLSGCALSPYRPKPGEAFYVPGADLKPLIKSLPVTPAEQQHAHILFNLLAGEFAGQRGDTKTALEYYAAAALVSTDPRVLERAAQLAIYLGDRPQAVSIVERWLQQAPDSFAAHEAAALLYLQMDRVDAAVQQLAILIMGKSQEVDERLADITRLLTREVSQESAFAATRTLAENYPKSAAAQYLYAWVASHYRRFSLALAQVDRALQWRPKWLAARLLKAQTQANSGDVDAARATLRALVYRDTENQQLRIVYAQFLFNTGDIKGAEYELRTVLRRHPRNQDARFALGLIYLQLQRDDEAYRALLPLAESEKWQAQVSYQLGRLAYKKGDYEQALEWFDQAAQESATIDPLWNSVLALMELRRTDEALTRLAVIQDRFPDEAPRVYLLRAEALSRAKRYREAFVELTNALNKLPDQPEILYARALLADKLDRVEVMEADLQAVLKNNPDNANALNALGYTLADRTERLDEAQGYLERALKIKPDDTAFLDSYGWLKFRQRDYRAAERYLRRAFQQSDDAEIAAHLAEVLWANGKRKEAVKLWRNALKSQPDHDFAPRIRQRLKELRL